MKRATAVYIAALVHAIPIAAWAMVKPLRVVAPEMAGLTCTADKICTDDITRINEARRLLTTSRLYVRAELGNIESTPTAIFCSTVKCSSKFGLGRSAAFSVANFGIVFSERAWQEFYVRHELIHQLQNERLGLITAWLFKPSWLIEGMAYARSQDPRTPLPEPLESWRVEYSKWEQHSDMTNIWESAKQVQ